MECPNRLPRNLEQTDADRMQIDRSHNDPGLQADLTSSGNIANHKQIEDSLRWSEEIYQLLFNTLPIGIGIADREKTVQAANRSMQEITGYSLNELKAFKIGHAIDDPNERFIICDLLRKSGQVRDYEIRLKRKDGSVYYAMLNIDHVEEIDSQGTFITTVRDITKRKNVEARLCRTEENFRRSLDNFPMGVRILTEEGETVYVNRALLKMYGYDSVEELKTTPAENHCTSGICAELAITAGKRKNDDYIPTEYETSIIGKNGEIRHLQVFRKDILWDGTRHFQFVYQDFTERRLAEQKLQNALDRLRKAVYVTIKAMASTVEARDPYTAGHHIRSAELAGDIAKEMGLPLDKIEGIRIAGRIHDIGKLCVPIEILVKPKELSEMEMSFVRQHSQKGYEILKDIDSPWPLSEIIYQHHERLDGSGYPRNLKGNEIIIEARILAVADVVESMASHRPYRPALGLEAALEEINRNKGKLYDSDVVDACLRLFQEKSFQFRS